MPVNSFLFVLCFVPAVCVLILGVRARLGRNAAQLVLLIASLTFYIYAGLASFVLLMSSITANWWAVRVMSRVDTEVAARKRVFVLALLLNVTVLCVFKYTAAISTIVRAQWGWPVEIPRLGFPLGLSFYTLTQVMYLVNCYEGVWKPVRWVELATFVSFFPNVTAGPILKAKVFFGQLQYLGERNVVAARVERSAALICLGLVKKVVLGDSFAQLASAGYSHVANLSTLEAWISSLAGTFEIYFDFSGYSDIAFGCAGLFGLTLTRNFNTPYRAATISEFWQRWHISLSEFITTYLYTPILRSMGKATLRKSAIATMIAMLIAGLWHGASWNYVIFGFLHGSALAIYQFWKRRKQPLPRLASIFLTFAFVNIAFVTVRATGLSEAIAMLRRLIPQADLLGYATLASALTDASIRVIAIPVILGSVVAFVGPDAESLASRFRPSVRSDVLVIALLLLAYVYSNSGAVTQFRYRQF